MNGVEERESVEGEHHAVTYTTGTGLRVHTRRNLPLGIVSSVKLTK